jgi:lipase
VTDVLQVYRYGPDRPTEVLAVHGLTGHGERWKTLAGRYLPDVAVAAPDLLGHGRSSWAAPWTIDANVAALADFLDREADRPVVVVGHSFGGAVSLALSAARPEAVAALVLLDPAVGLDGNWMREIAEQMLASPDYTDAAEARAEKADGSWSDVDPAELDRELDEHLIELPSGRVGWRICVPAIMSYWSELARPPVLPARRIPVTLVRATRTDPPYITEELLTSLTAATEFTLVDMDCKHMVAQARPAETAELIRDALRRR